MPKWACDRTEKKPKTKKTAAFMYLSRVVTAFMEMLSTCAAIGRNRTQRTRERQLPSVFALFVFFCGNSP
jgi:hypothetical protein